MSNSAKFTKMLTDCLDEVSSEVAKGVAPLRDRAVFELVKTAQHSGAMDVMDWLLDNGHVAIGVDAMTKFWTEGPGKEYNR